MSPAVTVICSAHPNWVLWDCAPATEVTALALLSFTPALALCPHSHRVQGLHLCAHSAHLTVSPPVRLRISQLLSANGLICSRVAEHPID